MRRFALALIVALLTVNASGVVSLVRAEPCSVNETAAGTDSKCPPACVTCGCCARAAEPVAPVAMSSPHIPVGDIRPAPPQWPKTNARDILHVPRLRLA